MHGPPAGINLRVDCKNPFFSSAASVNQHLVPQEGVKPPNAMSYFRITQIRSAIGLPGRTKGVLAALGLRKRMCTVYHPVSPDVAGQILKVKELVAVSEVDHPLTKAEQKELRRPDPGFYVESSALA